MQECLLTAWQKGKSCEGNSTLRTWLSGLMKCKRGRSPAWHPAAGGCRCLGHCAGTHEARWRQAALLRQGSKLSQGEGGTVRLSVGSEGKSYDLTVDKLPVAVGRIPNVEGLNPESVGVPYDQKGVKVAGQSNRTRLTPKVKALMTRLLAWRRS